MDAIHQRHGRPLAGCHTRRRIAGSEQALPLRLNGPAEKPFGMPLAQRGDGRQRVQNVPHGAEAHDEHTKLGSGR